LSASFCGFISVAVMWGGRVECLGGGLGADSHLRGTNLDTEEERVTACAWLRSSHSSEWPVHSTAQSWSVRVADQNPHPFLLSRLSARGDLGSLSYVPSLLCGSSACMAWCSNHAASELAQVWTTTRARLLAVAGAV